MMAVNTQSPEPDYFFNNDNRWASIFSAVECRDSLPLKKPLDIEGIEMASLEWNRAISIYKQDEIITLKVIYHTCFEPET
jgi:hypothetical protein